MRTSGDFWRARQMYSNAAAELPIFAKPHYELGFMNYLLGDFPGALSQFDQAAALVTDDDVEFGLWQRVQPQFSSQGSLFLKHAQR